MNAEDKLESTTLHSAYALARPLQRLVMRRARVALGWIFVASSKGIQHAPVVFKKAGVIVWIAVSMATWSGSGTAETAPLGTAGIDFGTAEKLNAEGFLKRCKGAAGVAELVNVQSDKNHRSAEHAGCVVGICKEPLLSVLDENFLREFFAEHCCYRSGAILYVSFFGGADKQPQWVYLASRRLSSAELRAACLAPNDR